MIEKNICYSESPHTRSYLDIYLPQNRVEHIFVYFHGGGLESGEKSFGCVDMLMKENIAVVCPNYRLYPQAKFPEFIKDAAEAVAWVKNNIHRFGSCNEIYVGGSSAGGYISMMLYFDNEYLEKYGLRCTDFSGFIFDAGQPTTHFNVLKERNINSKKVIIDEAAPLFYIDEYNNQPKMMILVADNDMENRYEQTQLMISTLKHFNYPESLIEYHLMENCTHCSYNNEEIFGKLISDFIKERDKFETKGF